MWTVYTAILCIKTSSAHHQNNHKANDSARLYLVGYGNSDLRDGSYMTGASFNNIGKEEMDICDLTVNGLESASYFMNAEEAAGEITIKILNKNGGQELDGEGNDLSFAYCAELDGDKFVNGYWDQDGVGPVEPGTVKFPTGTGLWMFVQTTCYLDESEEFDPTVNFYVEFPGIDE